MFFLTSQTGVMTFIFSIREFYEYGVAFRKKDNAN